MKFVKAFDADGKAFTRLDLEGLNVPPLQSSGKIQLLDFYYDTYKCMVGAGEEDSEWDKVFRPVHLFFKEKCTEDDLKDIAITLAVMHFSITSILGADGDIQGAQLRKLENDLSHYLHDLDQRTNLFPRLIDFVESGSIPIQSFAGVGERAQDTPEMSWYRRDVIPLMVIVIICKMLTPIFGVFMSCFKRKQKEGVIDGAYKEMHAVTILRDILNTRCHETVCKLENFLQRTIKRVLNKDEDLTHIYNGYTDNTVFQQIYAHMLIRRLVLVDLFRPLGENNLLTYITVCAKRSASTQFSLSNLKIAAQEFKYPNLKNKTSNSTDDGNLSNLEVESRSSNRTADYELIIELAADRTIDRFLSAYDMDTKAYEAACEYYLSSTHITLTNYSSYLMGIIFGAGLGGARSIEMLDPVHVTKLIALMQLYLVMQGNYTMAIACTAQPTGRIKEYLSTQDNILKSTWNYSYEFRNCSSKFQIALGGYDWSTGLKNSIMSFVTDEYEVNVAPIFWSLMNGTSLNQQKYEVSTTLSRDTCTFILQHYA